MPVMLPSNTVLSPRAAAVDVVKRAFGRFGFEDGPNGLKKEPTKPARVPLSADW